MASSTVPERIDGKRPFRLLNLEKYLQAQKSIADHNAANSPLLLLPPEIRCRIYDYAFGGFVIHLTTDDFQRKLILTQALCQSPQTCASLHFQHHRILPMGSKAFEDKCIQSSGDPTIARIKIPVHMLQVCRQIYHEAVLKPFDQTTFHFVTGPRGSGALSIFLKKLGLQHVEIDIHSYNDAHPSNMPFQSAPWHLGPLHDLEAFKHEGGVEWLKKTGLRSVRFTVSIATGGTPTDELRDSHHGVY